MIKSAINKNGENSVWKLWQYLLHFYHWKNIKPTVTIRVSHPQQLLHNMVLTLCLAIGLMVVRRWTTRSDVQTLALLPQIRHDLRITIRMQTAR